MGQAFSKYNGSSVLGKELDDSLSVPFKREIGIAIIVFYHRFMLKLKERYSLDVPPVLISLLGVLGGLHIVQQVKGKAVADEILKFLDPAATWFGFWMPLWLTPPLVVLPNALLSVKDADRKTWFKLAVVHLFLWCITALGTSKLYAILKSIATKGPSEPSPSPESASSVHQSGECGSPVMTSTRDVFQKKLKLLQFWGSVAVGFYGCSLAKMCDTAPALATTSVAAMVVGDMLPPTVKKVIHPVIFTAVTVSIATAVLHHVRKDPGSLLDSLSRYFANGKAVNGLTAGTLTAGDLFFSMLGPCCIGLALRIHTFLQLPEMREVLPAILGTSAISTLASILVSPLVARMVGLPPELAGVLSHRSITTSLAVPSAQSMGVSPELTVAAVLITGLYGTSSDGILSSLGISEDHVAAGVTMGMSSHALGTASLISLSRTAEASASLTMFSSGVFHALACSIPVLRQLAVLASGLETAL